MRRRLGLGGHARQNVEEAGDPGQGRATAQNQPAAEQKGKRKAGQAPNQ
jgi:hypothetical protein